MSEFLMQSERILFDNVDRRRNTNWIRYLPNQKILTKRFAYENLSESMISFQKYPPEELIIKCCDIHEYEFEDIHLNANIKSLAYHQNLLSLSPFLPSSSSISSFKQILPTSGTSQLRHLDLFFPGESSEEYSILMECPIVELPCLQTLTLTLDLEHCLFNLFKLGSSIFRIPKLMGNV